MTTTALKHTVLTAEQYLMDELERPEKYEFVNGVVYPMGGASAHHGLIATNFAILIGSQLPDNCQLFIADMKVQIETKETQCYYYPDVVVSCDQQDRADYFRKAPKLIIEILSPSTERVDRTAKLAHYKLIPSVEEIVLVAQNQPRVEIYRRAKDWQQEVFLGEDSFTLASVSLDFEMADVYKKCQFTEETDVPKNDQPR